MIAVLVCWLGLGEWSYVYYSFSVHTRECRLFNFSAWCYVLCLLVKFPGEIQAEIVNCIARRVVSHVRTFLLKDSIVLCVDDLLKWTWFKPNIEYVAEGRMWRPCIDVGPRYMVWFGTANGQFWAERATCMLRWPFSKGVFLGANCQLSCTFLGVMCFVSLLSSLGKYKLKWLIVLRIE